MQRLFAHGLFYRYQAQVSKSHYIAATNYTPLIRVPATKGLRLCSHET